MTFKAALMAAAAIVTIGVTSVCAQPIYPPPGNDPDGYYSRSDQSGYYDRNGHYQHIRMPDRNYGPPPPPPVAYEEGNCHRDNATTGTVLGAIAGGLIGGAAGHGNGAAIAGGVIGGGILGNVISRDIDCDDQPYAMRVYNTGLDGPIGYRSEWRHGRAYGYFTPEREFRRDGYVCREFTETSYRGDQTFTRTGTACRMEDGHWRFD